MANNWFRYGLQGFAEDGWTWDDTADKMKLVLVDMNDAGPTPGAWVITGVSNIATPVITTSQNHGLAVGDRITIGGVGGATGVNSTSANPYWDVATTPSGTTFTIGAVGAPGAYTSGGYLANLETQFLSAFVPSGGRLGVSPVLTGKAAPKGILDANDLSPAWTGIADAADIAEAVLLVRTAALPGDTDLADTAQRLVFFMDTGTGFPIDPTGNNINFAFDNGAYRIAEI
jgi:hypothetical protein